VYDQRAGITLITSSIRRFPPDCLDPKIHHCNLIQSILAKIEANHARADDAIMLDRDGFVAETNATHLFLVDAAGTVITPRALACPEGITRAAVLELCRTHGIPSIEREVSLAEFHRAAEVFCTGTMGELVPVRMIDGRPIGAPSAGLPGPLTARLTELFGELTRSEGEPLI
jgi:branched-chain amino acid aminotransferase